MTQEQFQAIIDLIQDARNKAIRAVNAELVILYWGVGGYISHQVHNEGWDKDTINELAQFIQKNYPELKGFSRKNLYRMQAFFETYTLSDTQPHSTFIQAISANNFYQNNLLKVSWTHHLLLLGRTKSREEKEFYLRLCIQDNYTAKDLDRQISASLFERTMIGNENLPPLIKASHPKILDNFKDAYIFEFLNLSEQYNESDLQRALLREMKQFILELGKDFLFIAQEYKVQVGNRDFFIDLLFYHRGLQCLVAFELKNTGFEPEHLGKLNFYLEALDRDVKKTNENPSIGILLCKDKDKEVVEYALSRSLSPTLVAQYELQLPDKALLQEKIHHLFQEKIDFGDL
jgi:predicted nuclease of restriction endonuclease-like (RecB) superfamily